MKRAFLMTMPVLATSALIAACGGSSRTTGSATRATTPASTAGHGYGGGGYGGSATSATSATSAGSATSATSAAAPPASGTAGSAGSGSATVISTKQTKLGMILAAGPKQLTVYLFEGDRGAASSCNGPCASLWPPVRVGGSPAVRGQAVAADLGTITRSDGTRQLTYKGHPLYYFARDKDSGDAYGQGVKAFGASWYVLAPSGRKIDNS